VGKTPTQAAQNCNPKHSNYHRYHNTPRFPVHRLVSQPFARFGIRRGSVLRQAAPESWSIVVGPLAQPATSLQPPALAGKVTIG